MIKLKSLIKESRNQPIDQSQFYQSITGEFKVAMENSSKNPLYRADGNLNESYYIIEPSKYRRTSMSSTFDGPVGTNNFHTALIDILPSWENWPKRSKSLIFSNDRNDVTKYGRNIFVVLPKNDAKIAVCPKNDFWSSFPNIKKDLYLYDIQQMNSQFTNTFDVLLDKKHNWLSISPEEIQHIFNEISNVDYETLVKTLASVNKSLWSKNAYAAMEIAALFKHYNNNWISLFDNVLNPETNGFEMKSLKEVYNSTESDREMFTEADCIMVEEDQFVEDINDD